MGGEEVLMPCNALHAQCLEPHGSMATGGARELHSRETVGHMVHNSLLRTADAAGLVTLAHCANAR